MEDLGYASHNYSATYHDMTFECVSDVSLALASIGPYSC